MFTYTSGSISLSTRNVFLKSSFNHQYDFLAMPIVILEQFQLYVSIQLHTYIVQ